MKAVIRINYQSLKILQVENTKEVIWKGKYNRALKKSVFFRITYIYNEGKNVILFVILYFHISIVFFSKTFNFVQI